MSKDLCSLWKLCESVAHREPLLCEVNQQPRVGQVVVDGRKLFVELVRDGTVERDESENDVGNIVDNDAGGNL